MLDNVLSSVRRGVERARVRGEEAYQATRLRLEIFNLNREQDTLYGRLGRAYHGGADVAVLEQIRTEIRRIDDEVRSREALIEELSHPVSEPAGSVAAAPVAPAPVSPAPSPAPVLSAARPEVSMSTPDDSAHVHKVPGVATPDSADGIPVASESGVPENAAVPGTGMNPAGIYQTGQTGAGQSGGLLDVQRPPETPEHRQQGAVHQAELREGDMSNARPDPLEK